MFQHDECPPRLIQPRRARVAKRDNADFWNGSKISANNDKTDICAPSDVAQIARPHCGWLEEIGSMSVQRAFALRDDSRLRFRTGNGVLLLRSADQPETWAASSAQAETWTNKTAQSETWTNR